VIGAFANTGLSVDRGNEVILKSVCNSIVLSKEWKGTLKKCPDIRRDTKDQCT